MYATVPKMKSTLDVLSMDIRSILLAAEDELSLSDLKSALEGMRVDLVPCSGWTWHFDPTDDLLKLVQECGYETTETPGGYYVSI